MERATMKFLLSVAFFCFYSASAFAQSELSAKVWAMLPPTSGTSIVYTPMEFNGVEAEPKTVAFCVTPDDAPGTATQQTLVAGVLEHGGYIGVGGPIYFSFYEPQAGLVSAAIKEAKRHNIALGCGGVGLHSREALLWYNPGNNEPQTLLWKSCAIDKGKETVTGTSASAALATLFVKYISCGNGVR
jgi:hypothetical protein